MMTLEQLKQQNSYTGWSGVNITLYTSEKPRKEITELQAVSFSQIRDMRPINTNSVKPRSLQIVGYLILSKDFDCPGSNIDLEIEILYTDEHGDSANMYILGVKILDEGLPVKNVKKDQQYTFTAKEVIPWKWIKLGEYS